MQWIVMVFISEYCIKFLVAVGNVALHTVSKWNKMWKNAIFISLFFNSIYCRCNMRQMTQFGYSRFMTKIFVVIAIDPKANKGLENCRIIRCKERVVHRSISNSIFMEFCHCFIQLEHFSRCHSNRTVQTFYFLYGL